MSGLVPGSPIEYEALQDVTPGDVVAVQVRPTNTSGDPDPVPTTPPTEASHDPRWYVFEGEVRHTDCWNADVDPEGLFVDGRHLTEGTSLASISVDPHLLWEITTEGIKDASRKVTRVPPITSSPNAPDDGPPPCLLSYRPDQHTHFVVHEARADRGEIYHFSRSLGSVVNAVYGTTVEAERVLPPGYGPPE